MCSGDHCSMPKRDHKEIKSQYLMSGGNNYSMPKMDHKEPESQYLHPALRLSKRYKTNVDCTNVLMGINNKTNDTNMHHSNSNRPSNTNNHEIKEVLSVGSNPVGSLAPDNNKEGMGNNK